MTDEEMARAYIIKIYDLRKDLEPWRIKKDNEWRMVFNAFLAGLKAGKDMAEADLATVAYMQGAERYKPKWHKVADKLPEENQWVLVYDGSYTVCNYHSYTPIRWLDNYENEVYEGNIIAWCEIPKYTEE